jgi:hypothetical protein
MYKLNLICSAWFWCATGAAVLSSAIVLGAGDSSAVVTLTFEELSDGEVVNDFYEGRYGGTNAGPGPNLGFALMGGTARLGAGVTHLVYTDGAGQAVKSNAIAGSGMIIIGSRDPFNRGFSLYCSNPDASTEIRVFEERGLRGRVVGMKIFNPTRLGSETPLVPMGLTVAGPYKSVGILSRGPGEMIVDNVTFGSAFPFKEPDQAP